MYLLDYEIVSGDPKQTDRPARRRNGTSVRLHNETIIIVAIIIEQSLPRITGIVKFPERSQGERN